MTRTRPAGGRVRPALARLVPFVVSATAVAWLAPPVGAGGAPAAVPPVAAVGGAPASHDHSAHTHGENENGAHEGDEGLRLAPSRKETVAPGGRCDRRSPVRRYDIAAIRVDITLNQYLDHDPEGRMYALEHDVERVREEEERNRRAREEGTPPAVSAGLQGDAIRPLTLRVLPGECLRVTLRNALGGDEAASFHVHGSALRVAGGGPALATNPDAIAHPGRRVTYEWMVPPDQPEGTHYAHSHADDRAQTGHGLFGAVIVEPPGARWSDTLAGGDDRAPWAAIVETPDGGSFREFVLYYHEVGDETYQLLDGRDQLVPLVDPITHIYRPGARALNYRSEPFMNRLALQQRAHGYVDESLAYSSYAYGDPATPLLRSYVGDRVKQRVVHAGPEVFHVHHVHGGGTRWRRQAGLEPPRAPGLDKRPPLLPERSDRTDSQTIGPSESYDVEDECGAGGCQQSVGDFMFHCHVTQHYFAGMWGIWRVYNTLQDGDASTDTLPPLRPLPDGGATVVPAVTSDSLASATVERAGQPHRVDDVAAWVAAQLPPPGVPKGYDASVFDWEMDGLVARGEPETDAVWPPYRSPSPGVRPPLLFDPRTGKLAFPFLRPHLMRRPPFAPAHGPAPFLEPLHPPGGPAPPGANGPESVCPDATRPREMSLTAIAAPIVMNREANIVDPQGQLFVLHEEADAVRADPARRVPLVLRTNATEECLDVLYRSELPDLPEDPFNKTGAHIHFMQFDVQASDGVNTGFNYEQTVRPYALAGEQLTADAAPGSDSVVVASAERFQAGAVLGIGMDRSETFETRRVRRVEGSRLVFDAPLRHAHAAGEFVSAEFVRYRWYPDVQFGTAFFHDHVNVPFSGRHGLYGAIVAEPPGSTYHDPHTGAPVKSGPLADIRTDARSSVDVEGSFRELVLGLQDDNLLSHVGRSTGGAVNARVEPLDARLRANPDPSALFAGDDPETAVLEAHLGDPMVFRTFVGANNEVHSWHLDGHWFRIEPHLREARPASTVNVGISERFDVFVPAAGGPQRMPGDYLWYAGRTSKLREGTWGIVRVHPPDAGGLVPLPGRRPAPPPAEGICADGAPLRSYDVSAIEVPLPMLGGEDGLVYVLERDREAVLSGRHPPHPLVLHVGVGDCIEIALTNRTATGPVSFHADMLAVDPAASAGVQAGRNPAQAVAPGERRVQWLYASPEVGETTALVRDFGNVLENPGRGLYGAIVVGPAGARYVDPVTGEDVSDASAWRVDVVPPRGRPWRDVTLFVHDEDAGIGNHRMPYTTEVAGAVAVNYRSAPLEERLEHAQSSNVYDVDGPAGPAGTPVVEAYAGDPVTMRVLAPSSEQARVFSVEGHEWPVEPDATGSTLVSSAAVVALDALELRLVGGAGGRAAIAGDYVYGDHRLPYREAGAWGIFRVRPCDDRLPGLQRLEGIDCARRDTSPRPWLLGLTGTGALAVFAGVYRRRRRVAAG